MRNAPLWFRILIARIGKVDETRENERNEIGLRENETEEEPG
jgi:hypothetical protein